MTNEMKWTREVVELQWCQPFYLCRVLVARTIQHNTIQYNCCSGGDDGDDVL